MILRFLFCSFIAFFICLLPALSQAEDKADYVFKGDLKLNTVPTSRMEETGTIRVSTGTLDPYLQTSIGVQIADPLFISLRQTAGISSINGSADRLYPGLDLKLRFLREGDYRPEISLGLDSAFGHKRMASEYIAFSKRFEDFDFTAGIAWGRLGSAAQMSNPLKALHKHFGKIRSLDGERPNDINDWFTGENVGFFGGFEYFTPLKGISLKADWGADRYIIEQTQFNFDPPKPWGFGIRYAPTDWINIGGALIGGQKLMGNLSLKAPIKKWPGRKEKKTKRPYFRPYRTDLSLPSQIEIAASRDNVILENTHRYKHRIESFLNINPDTSLPQQIGRAASYMANHAGKSVEEFVITPLKFGLRGSSIHLMRRDLEQALARKQGSPQEIWQNIDITESYNLSTKKPNPFHDALALKPVHHFRLILDNQLSLSEEDSGILYRTALIPEVKTKITARLMGGAGLRLNLKDNLHNLNALRPLALFPVRSNIDDFASRTIALDHAYLSWMTTLRPDLHIAFTTGVLEEMYTGTGAEILYRPFGKTFVLGAELWDALKREPRTSLNLGLNGDHLLTGHVNVWYEVPETNMTFQARIGRYLAEDTGATLSLQQEFKNGVSLKGFVTATNKADFDIFGGTTHLYSGLQFHIPIGNLLHIPNGSAIHIKMAPFGRDSGQALEKPLSLYELTEPLSYRHLGTYWTDLLD